MAQNCWVEGCETEATTTVLGTTCCIEHVKKTWNALMGVLHPGVHDRAEPIKLPPAE